MFVALAGLHESVVLFDWLNVSVVWTQSHQCQYDYAFIGFEIILPTAESKIKFCLLSGHWSDLFPPHILVHTHWPCSAQSSSYLLRKWRNIPLDVTFSWIYSTSDTIASPIFLTKKILWIVDIPSPWQTFVSNSARIRRMLPWLFLVQGHCCKVLSAWPLLWD